jgi:hypothetical protein
LFHAYLYSFEGHVNLALSSDAWQDPMVQTSMLITRALEHHADRARSGQAASVSSSVDADGEPELNFDDSKSDYSDSNSGFGHVFVDELEAQRDQQPHYPNDSRSAHSSVASAHSGTGSDRSLSVGSGGATLVDSTERRYAETAFDQDDSAPASPATPINEALLDHRIYEREMTLPPVSEVVSFSSEFSSNEAARKLMLEQYNRMEMQVNEWRSAVPEDPNTYMDEEQIENDIVTHPIFLGQRPERPWRRLQRQLAASGLAGYTPKSALGGVEEESEDSDGEDEVDQILETASLLSSARSIPLDLPDIEGAWEC